MKKHLSVKPLLLALAVALIFPLASGVSAQPGEFVNGVLQPLADGFPNQNIVIIVPDDPGSRDDLYAKSLQTALKNISPVNVLVSAEPAPSGGTFYTLREVLERQGGKEGYYPIVLSAFGVVTDLMVTPGVRKIGAKLEDINMIIATDLLPYIMIQRKNAPWGPTLAGMVKYGKENPGKLRYISKEIGTGTDIACEYLLNILGLQVEKIPQGSHQEVASTVGAGAGDFALAQAHIALTNWQAGRVDVTLALGNYVPEQFRKVPDILTAKQANINTMITGNELGLCTSSQSVPQLHVDWLYKLFNAAATSEVHQKRAETIPGLEFNIVDGAEANDRNREIYKITDPLLRTIGLHLDVQKKK